MAIRQIGSQNREEFREAGYSLVQFNKDGSLIVQDESGKRELWAPNDDFAGYVLEVHGFGYEFVRSLP
jgi:hypothetical protein